MLADIRPTHHNAESCQQTVHEAITAFHEANSFYDAIRNAVSLGFYGIWQAFQT